MAVAVQRPQRRESDLDTIMKGLSIANQVFGIKANFDKLDMMRQNEQRQQEQRQLELDERERKARGELTPGEVQGYIMQGAKEVGKGTEGSFGLKVQGVEQVPVEGGQPGETEERETVKERFFISPQAMAAEKKATELAQKIANDDKKAVEKKQKDLRAEYNKASDDVMDAYKGYRKVEAAALSPTPTGATDVALVFGFMKTIDPTSVVREGEFATAENTSGIPDRVRLQYNKALKGERLSPEQRANFLRAAREQMKSQLDIQKDTDARFQQLAKQAGVDAEFIINPIFDQVSDQLSDQLLTPQQAPQNQSFSGTIPLIESEAKATPPKNTTQDVRRDPDIMNFLGR